MSTKQKIRIAIQNSYVVTYWAAKVYLLVPGVIALRYRFRWAFRAHIALSAKITGWSACIFGKNSVIGAGSWININHRNVLEASLVIGDNSFIGQYNFMTVGNFIGFGPYCLTGSHCSFIGSSHVATDPMKPYACTGTTADASIIIGANCFFGYGSMVQGNVRIGHGSIVGAGAVVRSDVPPFSIVVGNPARVARHFDFTTGQWLSGMRDINSLTSIPNEQDYIAKLNKSHPNLIQPLAAAYSFLGDV